MKHHAIHSDPVALGFQIAPMIDVVFVIMLFFMVVVGSMKKEAQIGLRLPCPDDLATDVRFPDNEVTLGVQEDGTVTLNDEVFDSIGNKALPTLTQTLRRLTLSSGRQGDKVLATVKAEEFASYDRIIDVLNALQKAQIENVTFAVGGPS